ncbi:hypothetical protein [Streptomyces sp. NPDC006997]|uniref:hypothetical protein n=1 Tax=Streptomyces sp. NPDC006997 TaxID=3155356 RepID=UPI0033E24A22
MHGIGHVIGTLGGIDHHLPTGDELHPKQRVQSDPPKPVRLDPSLEASGPVRILVLPMPPIVLPPPELGQGPREVTVGSHTLGPKLLLSHEHLIPSSRPPLEQMRHGNTEQRPQNSDQS